MRVPFWVPRTLFGFVACGLIGITIFAIFAFVAFDGRIFALVTAPSSGASSCLTSSCFHSQQLEFATAAAVALVSGTWIGTRLESRWLHYQNNVSLDKAQATDGSFYGPSSADVAAFLEKIPSHLNPESVGRVRIDTYTDEAYVATLTKAMRLAYLGGQALALNFYVERAQDATLAKMRASTDNAEGAPAQFFVRAVALLVLKDYFDLATFTNAWKPYAVVFGAMNPLSAWPQPATGDRAVSTGSATGVDGTHEEAKEGLADGAQGPLDASGMIGITGLAEDDGRSLSGRQQSTLDAARGQPCQAEAVARRTAAASVEFRTESLLDNLEPYFCLGFDSIVAYGFATAEVIEAVRLLVRTQESPVLWWNAEMMRDLERLDTREDAVVRIGLHFTYRWTPEG